jgi:cytochrome c oxidase subunit 2
MKLWAVALVGAAIRSPDRSMFSPAGPAAEAIASLGWWLTAVCLIVALGSICLFLIALFRGGTARAEDGGRPERLKIFWVALGLLVTVLILSGFVSASFLTDRKLSRLGAQAAAVDVEIIAHQWWWEIRYLDPTPSAGFVTANELHLPQGEAVSLRLSSDDVIHSLWIPNLDRKWDIIPGRSQSVELTTGQAGLWHGRCAEFCGYQHAHMDLTAIVEPREAFDRWRARQVLPAQAADSALGRRGADIFAQSFCGTCHVVRGSDAPGYSGTAPDLTHLASRTTLAAGTLPNRRDTLAAWIADPQHFKPGTKMTVNTLPPADADALVSYLESLQ